MPQTTRRSILSAVAAALPAGLASRARASDDSGREALTLRFRPFEEAVRDAFLDPANDLRRIEVGDSDRVRNGVQGCHNDRPFAGLPAGALRIVRTASEPGLECRGVRLFVTTVDVVLARDLASGDPGRPLDFASLPPAPVLPG